MLLSDLRQNIFTMIVAKKFVIAKHFDGEPKPSDLTLVEEELPPIKDGGNYSFIQIEHLIF